VEQYKHPIQRMELENEHARVMFIERRRPDWPYGDKYYRQSDWKRDNRNYREEPRMYVSADVSESIVENLANRTRRPYTIWKKQIPVALAGLGISLNLEGMRWSKNAGCTLCPCSPGFVIPQQEIGVRPGNAPVKHFDVWVTLKGAPSVDETKPARVI